MQYNNFFTRVASGPQKLYDYHQDQVDIHGRMYDDNKQFLSLDTGNPVRALAIAARRLHNEASNAHQDAMIAHERNAPSASLMSARAIGMSSSALLIQDELHTQRNMNSGPYDNTYGTIGPGKDRTRILDTYDDNTYGTIGPGPAAGGPIIL